MPKKDLDTYTFLKIVDEFGGEAALQTRNNFLKGKITNELLDKHLFKFESKKDYIARVLKEGALFEKLVNNIKL